MERTLFDGQHDYRATPSEYPISNNNSPIYYDQFIKLRDTLIFSDKQYNDKASKKLCVGDKGDGTTTNTIEVWETNYFRQSFNQSWSSGDMNTSTLPLPKGRYVMRVPDSIIADYQFPQLCCMIKKDGLYRIMHKEEILLSATTNKVFCYVDIYRKDGNGVYKIPQDKKGGTAVFDWEGNTSLSGTTSGTEPDGDCTVPITLGKLFKKMTASSIMEVNLLKDDILVLRFQDGTYDPTTGEPTGNPLTIQNYSNYWSIEYLDLPYNI